MTPAFQKLFLALFVSVVLQLSLSARVEAAHGDSHVRRSLTHKNLVVVDRSDNNVLRSLSKDVTRDEGFVDSILGEYPRFA